jgi:hypothetical protein
MTPGFDIFQTEPGGQVLWRGTAPTLEEARARIQELSVSSPGDYLILNPNTGDKIILKFDGKASGPRLRNGAIPDSSC